MKNGAAVMSLAPGSVCGGRMVIPCMMDLLGVRVQHAQVDQLCILASLVRESAMMTIEYNCSKMIDPTYLVRQ